MLHLEENKRQGDRRHCVVELTVGLIDPSCLGPVARWSPESCRGYTFSTERHTAWTKPKRCDLIERMIKRDELIHLASQKESHFFDKKSADISGKKVQKIAVAFANADGGEFIIGIADEKDEPDPAKAWCGADSLEALNGHLQAIFEVQPALDVRYEVLTCE